MEKTSGAGPGLTGRLRLLALTVSRATVDNPVLVKEFRTRMRGTRAYWLLLGYTLLLAGVLSVMYFAFEADAAAREDYWSGGSPARAAHELGRMMYHFIFIAQALMVALITPAVTAGAVTIEREQRSYELLVTTPLRPIDIIRGKLSAAVSFVVLLLTASLPLVSLSFLAGGVSPAEVLCSYLLIALSAFVYGSFGIFWSAALNTTAAATIITYLTVMAFGLLTFIPGMIGFSAGAGRGTGLPEMPFQSVNPVTATLNGVRPEFLFSLQIPTWISAAILNLLLGMLVANTATSRLEHFEPPRPFWTRFLATLLWCAGTLFLFAPILGGMAPGWNAKTLQQATGAILMPMLVLAALVTPIFTTGDLVLRRGESALRRYLSGFSPRRLFSDDLSCGVPLVLSWLVFVLALLPAAVLLAGKWSLFEPAAVYLPGAILCIAAVLGLAGVASLLSVSLPSRWAAAVLTYLVGVVLMLLPYLSLIPYYQAPSRSPGFLWQVLYLVPFEGLYQLAEPDSYWGQRPGLLFGRVVPVWLVTSAFYLVLAAGCFALTVVLIRRADERLRAGTNGPEPDPAA